MSEHDVASLPACPECGEDYTYEAQGNLACPMCGHEWLPEGDADPSAEKTTDDDAVRDAHGNVLQDGDDVTVITSVKIAGGGGATVKAGTKVRGIRLTEDHGDGHNIDAKIAGIGRLKLKSSIVKKS